MFDERTGRFFAKAVTRIGKKALSRTMIKLLDMYTPEQIQKLIDTNTSLLELYVVLSQEYQQHGGTRWRPKSNQAWNFVTILLSGAKKVSSKIPREIIEKNLTYDKAIEFLENERKTEYVDMFKTERGRKWLERNLTEFKQFLYTK